MWLKLCSENMGSILVNSSCSKAFALVATIISHKKRHLDRFKSKRTLTFWPFSDLFDYFEGNSRLLSHSAEKIQGFEIECEP
jgi:hypothetical protein